MYLVFLMGNQVLEMIIIVLGSIRNGYYDYDTVDGYKYFRYVNYSLKLFIVLSNWRVNCLKCIMSCYSYWACFYIACTKIL